METYHQIALAKDLSNLQHQLDQERERFSSLSPVQRIAEILHDRQCRSEHPGSCGWERETWGQKDPHSTHSRFLDRAKKLLEVAKNDEKLALKILEAIFS